MALGMPGGGGFLPPAILKPDRRLGRRIPKPSVARHLEAGAARTGGFHRVSFKACGLLRRQPLNILRRLQNPRTMLRRFRRRGAGAHRAQQGVVLGQRLPLGMRGQAVGQEVRIFDRGHA